ncbi:Hpt domain-containing protein [Psychrobacter aestuarii]|uniref:histidine kinase n=1 Tax=Psychrobacter aestuarii TaxID=556327 RepID=A0ABP3FG14_9GAMM|nr:Hpt domain-containing protein [Psychrobacter aestuarii]
MKNQPNEMVTLEWLLPLLNQQLEQLSEGWLEDTQAADIAPLAQHYHDIDGALVMAQLPRLADLAGALSLLAAACARQSMDASVSRQAIFAHQLLQHELMAYIQTGVYREAMVYKTIDGLIELAQQLSDSRDDTDIAPRIQRLRARITAPALDAVDAVSHEPFVLPDLEYRAQLSQWQTEAQALSAHNINHPERLAALQAISHTLWQNISDAVHQRLWYVVEIWLDNLARNTQPTPEAYSAILSELERMIAVYAACQSDAKLDSVSAGRIEAIIADIYLNMSRFADLDDAGKTLIHQMPASDVLSARFLPRILNDIESIIFTLDRPLSLIEPLRRVEERLGMRGWKLYEAQVTQILDDVETTAHSEEAFAQVQWQIERQLQELYSAIYHTEQTIRTKIGDATSFTVQAQRAEDETPPLSHIDDHALRELRILVESVKRHFNDYVQRQRPQLLPPMETFTQIAHAFEDMGLPEARAVTDNIASLFTQIIAHDLHTLGWKLTQSLAEGLSAIELLLDYLAQQVLDAPLLVQAASYIDEASHLLDDLIARPIDHTDGNDSRAALAYTSLQNAAENVVRYDDSGEIVPDDIETAESDNTHSDTEGALPEHDAADDADADSDEHGDSEQTETAEKAAPAVPEQSALLQEARSKTKPDSFEIDEEIREIFIEEVDEVLETLEEFLPIWQHAPQDLTPLTEVRRSFHTLKGSGRMVGAFSISEMAWAVENLLNRVLDKTLEVSDEVVTVVLSAVDATKPLIADFAAGEPPTVDTAVIILHCDNLLAHRDYNDGLPASVAAGQDSVHHDAALESVSDTLSAPVLTSDTDTIADTAHTASEASPVASASADTGMAGQVPDVLMPFIDEAVLPADSDDADPDIKEIFIEEAEEVLEEIVPLYEQWQQAPESLDVLKDVRRGFHTLKGSGRMVGAHHSAELAWSIENMLNRILDHTVTVSTGMVALVGDVLDAYPELIEIFAQQHRAYPQKMALWVACANAYNKQLGDAFTYLDVQADAPADEIQDSYEADVEAPIVDETLQTLYSVSEMIGETPVIEHIPDDEERELCHIFVEEAQSLLQVIDGFISEHEQDTETAVSDELVRAFHTLRGASGSCSLSAISEVSAAIEKSLEQLQHHDTPINAQHLQALKQSAVLIKEYLINYEEGLQQHETAAPDRTQQEQELLSLQGMLESTEQPVTSVSHLNVVELLDIGVDDLLDADMELESVLASANETQLLHYANQQQQQITALMSQTQSSRKFTRILTTLQNAYTLLAQHLEVRFKPEFVALLLGGHKQLVGLFDALAASMSLKVDEAALESSERWLADYEATASRHDNAADVAPVVEDSAPPSADMAPVTAVAPVISAEPMPVKPVQTTSAEQSKPEVIDTDIELLEIFLEEAQELDTAVATTFGTWRDDIYNLSALKVLQRHLHTIKGGARMAGIQSIGDLTHEAESIYEAFVENTIEPTDQWFTIMQMVQDTLSLQIDHVVRYQESFFANELIEQLQAFLYMKELPETVTLVLPALQGQNAAQTEEEIVTPEEDITTQADSDDIVSLDMMVDASWSDGLPDPDILEVFLEEADELILSSSKYLQLFLNNISDLVALQTLQRNLHTIKGGARMVSANGIADLAHQMETVYEELAIRRRPATKMVAQLLVACHDWLSDAVFILKHKINAPMPSALIGALQKFIKNPDSLKSIPTQSLQTQLSAVLAKQNKQETVRRVEDISRMPPMTGQFDTQQQSSTNEMIRISSNLIEHMINLSGESAINRARIDMGMSSLTNSLEEMGTTVQRLADQLRRMEIELEAQILSQIDDAELIENEGFDPLEMDQYSALNQLSKSLTESASDLLDINNTLLEKTRDNENLLLQLSRTQADLQNGLMSSRIVPFSRLIPRLERIVRQTGNELNKSVSLVVDNADDEMDRTILERITSPLEHMLRNAVDHGIESPQERLEAGKERNGQIRLELMREGSEMVIHLSDDGRGINVEAVRQKAIAQGLIDENDRLSDLEVMQYIFNAGLTTTKTVTQISGRGVGMDVVISEIRQLGGVVSVNSVAGQGSRFTIRVPLTVAVSDALIVRAADRYYAIPLVHIERVVRIEPEHLYDYYRSERATMRIENNDYRVRYLNEILTGSKLNELAVNTSSSLPVIIIKNRAGQNLALQVDQIAGSRIEVVVKPLGRQLSHLAGISAATIMGDGSVMLILDPIALMRNTTIMKEMKQVSQSTSQSRDDKKVSVLVVDDSVTVRKVTSRFLERQGITAMVAKDGIDAIEILQEALPDLILLDIEMPRMDGFEVATQVRHNNRLRDIPIIMITSRTGEKHRERAFETGVNDYMGKPFQENELLNKIQTLLGIELSATDD